MTILQTLTSTSDVTKSWVNYMIILKTFPSTIAVILRHELII